MWLPRLLPSWGLSFFGDAFLFFERGFSFPEFSFFPFSESEHTRGGYAVFQIARRCDLTPYLRNDASYHQTK